MSDDQRGREIKFRVWGYDFRGCTYQHGYTVGFGGWRDQTNSDLLICAPMSDGTVIEQFTGLKDKNGKDVFEGDILRSYNWDTPQTGVVLFSRNGYFAVNDIDGYNLGIRDGELFNQPGDPWMLFACEVIGNIHEDASLLVSA